MALPATSKPISRCGTPCSLISTHHSRTSVNFDSSSGFAAGINALMARSRIGCASCFDFGSVARDVAMTGVIHFVLRSPECAGYDARKRTVTKVRYWPDPAGGAQAGWSSGATTVTFRLFSGPGVRSRIDEPNRTESTSDAAIRCGDSAPGVHALRRGLASRLSRPCPQHGSTMSRDKSRQANASNGNTRTEPCAHQIARARARLSAAGSSTRRSSPRCLRSACHLRWRSRRPNTSRGG